MSRLGERLLHRTLLLGLALALGCGPRSKPVTPPPAGPTMSPVVADLPDEYVDLSAIARVLTLPALQQEAIWRTWARESAPDDRQRVALAMLARRADPSDVSIVLDAFERGTPKIRRLALRAILAFGPEISRGARDRLWSAVQRAPSSVTPELIWALVSAREPRVYDLAVAWYAHPTDPLSSVRALDGTAAFDPPLIGMLDLGRTLPLAQAREPRMRLLVARTCSRVAQTECTPWLVRLASDPVAEVSAAAAPGLVKIGSVETHEALTRVLRSADEPQRARLLHALREEAGLAGLTAALDSVSPQPERGLSEAAQIFALILEGQAPGHPSTLDPRGADALEEYVQHAPHLYSRTWAAIALARLGDTRGLPALAARLRLTPEQAYAGDTEFERRLRRDDTERGVIADALAELADAVPEQAGEIRRASEDALLGWLRQANPMPPSALRALATMRSTKLVAHLGAWALVGTPLPRPTDAPLASHPSDWSWAQESLQALGRVRDGTSLALLQKSLRRRPKELDLTQQALAAAPHDPRRTVLRLLAAGAINGLAELGDPRAAGPLFLFADDPLENEVNRAEACRALAWVATERDRDRVLARLSELRQTGKTADPRFFCFLETFAHRAAPDFKPALFRLLEELSLSGEVTAALLAAQAVGRIGIDVQDETALQSLLQREDSSALPTALALLWGARPEMAQWAGLRLLARPAAQQQQLEQAYAEALSQLSEQDLRGGALYRLVDNAFALEQAGARAVHWPRRALVRRLTSSAAPSMPHAMSPLQFRLLAYQAALEGNTAAVEALLAAGEAGSLLALRDTPGPSSHAAYLAHRRSLEAR